MDAKELTIKHYEHENQITELRGRVHVIEEKNLKLELKIKDLIYLEKYVEQINNRVRSLERK